MNDVELSCWKVAIKSAEPVRAKTVERFIEAFAPHGFSAETMLPSCGMAEATLLISGQKAGFGPVAGEPQPAAEELRRAGACE